LNARRTPTPPTPRVPPAALKGEAIALWMVCGVHGRRVRASDLTNLRGFALTHFEPKVWGSGS